MRSDALEPYGPRGVLQSVAADVWVVEGPQIAFGYLGVDLPFPTRMTVVRLPGGGLWLHSPTAAEPDLLARIRELGPVRFLVAPNSLHYWWIPDWKAAFPDAEVHAAPGLARSAKRSLPAHLVLGDTPPAGWADAIDQVLVKGGVFTEIDFFHRASRTLVLTDLIENFEPRRVRSGLLRALLRFGGVLDPDGKTPIDMQLSFLGRRRGVRAAVQRMLAWDPQRVILAHGRWYAANGAAELRRAFRWVL